jgi:uncharacterized protein YegP (UPF0339 family)
VAAARIEIFRTDRGQYAFRLLTKHGEVVATGESHATHAKAQAGVVDMLKAISKAKIYDLTDTQPIP